MSAKPKKRIAPTLVSQVPDANATNGALATNANAFEAAAKKKNPLENAADLIAMRYGVSGEAPQINESIFAQNRAIGKKVVPLKEYFEQTAKEFKEKEAQQKEEAAQIAKLSPCQRKMNTLQRNIDGYIQACDPELSNEAMIEMMDQARTKARTKAQDTARTNARDKRDNERTKTKSRTNAQTKKKSRKHTNSFNRASSSKKGGRR